MPFGVEFHDAAVPKSGRVSSGSIDYTNIVFSFFFLVSHASALGRVLAGTPCRGERCLPEISVNRRKPPSPTPILCFQDQALEDKWEARESARRRDLMHAQTDYSKVRTLLFFHPLMYGSSICSKFCFSDLGGDKRDGCSMRCSYRVQGAGLSLSTTSDELRVSGSTSHAPKCGLSAQNPAVSRGDEVSSV